MPGFLSLLTLTREAESTVLPVAGVLQGPGQAGIEGHVLSPRQQHQCS